MSGILHQAGLAAHGRLKYRNALIHCDEVRQNLSAIQNREFRARSTVSQGAIVGCAESAGRLSASAAGLDDVTACAKG